MGHADSEGGNGAGGSSNGAGGNGSSAGGNGPAASASVAAAALERQIVALLDEALAGGLGSAAAVSIGDGGVELVRCWRGALWRRPTPGPPVTEASWFDLASLTKPMVSAALAMIFVERGLLELHAPVRAYVADPATAAAESTVAQLLAHTAGCAAHVKFFERWDELTVPGEGWDATLQRLARRHPLAHQPGRETAYSDLGYILLGQLLETVGAARLDTLFAEHIAAPLGLTAGFRPPGEPRSAAAAAHDGLVANELGAPPAASPSSIIAPAAPAGPLLGQVHDENARAGGGVFGHAGLFGRIGDVATFARALLGGALVRTETAAAFFALAPNPAASWRLGWDTPSTTAGLSHAGDLWPRAGTVGHLGFTGTSLWLHPPRRRWCALLTNRVHPTREGTAPAIKQLRRAVMDAAWAGLPAV